MFLQHYLLSRLYTSYFHSMLQTENLDIDEFYNEIVHDMEEVLLDSGKTPEARFSQDNRMFQSELSLPLRDGGSTASTSGTDDASPLIQNPLRIDGVEVVGARQKKGDVSFSERLVGVKEHTVYEIRVWSGNDQWEVERRYRDFFTLYRQLKTSFADQDWILPSPWSAVEKESRKIFGNASPDVVAERSVLIQECLRSILHFKFLSSPPTALIWFLSPQDSFPSSPMSNTLVPPSTSFARRADTENISTLGQTISLIVEIQPYKHMKQMLEAQHYSCAGCHKHFDDEKTLMRDFVQTFGWGKPRLCEYTSQLYCSSCHTNETAVLPARVLHHWDFTHYPVSQLAKSYLESIHDQVIQRQAPTLLVWNVVIYSFSMHTNDQDSLSKNIIVLFMCSFSFFFLAKSKNIVTYTSCNIYHMYATPSYHMYSMSKIRCCWGKQDISHVCRTKLCEQSYLSPSLRPHFCKENYSSIAEKLIVDIESIYIYLKKKKYFM